MTSVLALGFGLAAFFFVVNTALRRRGDERLQRRVTYTLIAMIFATVATIFAAIQLGFITDHYP
jgi:tellurite resistance protein TehA-like permease